MDPILASTLIGAGSNILGGMIGADAAEEDRDAARAMQRKALAQYAGLEGPEFITDLPNLPEYQALSDINYIAPEFVAADYSRVADYDPRMQEMVQAGPSRMEGISTDPNLRAAQLKALEQLQSMGEGGLTAGDRFTMEQIAQDEARRERGARDAIMQNMQSRGVQGSGLELAQMLGAQQGAAERRSMRDLGVEAQAQQRALDAIMQAGELGGSIRGQEFGEKSDIASAADIINRYNAGMRADIQGANTAALNEAQRYNIENARGDIRDLADIQNRSLEAQALAANQSTDANGYAQEYQNRMLSDIYGQGMDRTGYLNDLSQKQFSNEYDIARSKAGAYGAQSDALSQQADRAAGQWTAAGQAIGEGAGQVADYYDRQKEREMKYGSK